MRWQGLRFWGGISAALHVVVLLLVLLDLAARKFEPPQEQAFEVEFVNAQPAQLAQGERPTPGPPATPDPVPQPPKPDPQMPDPRPAPVAPPPPPPPPPPAHAPPPTPQAQRVPRPSPPPPVAAPDPAPVPPRPQQQAQVTPPARPEPPRPTQAPPRPEPPLPLPPPPVPPPPQPAQTPGTGTTPPVQRPQERSTSRENTLERLRQELQQREAPRARANPAPSTPQQGGGAPTGTAALTAAERSGLADKIGECWSVDAGAPNLRDIVVELRVDIDAGGTVRNVRPNGSVPTDPRARSVYEAARRALLNPQCNPLPLPRERLAAIRDTVFRFNPRDLGLR